MLEILAPAGNAECAEAAIANGANAVYLGLSAFSARQGAENFDASALTETVKNAHLRGVKVYVAMNTLVKDGEIDSFLTALLSAWNTGVDAIILHDIFIGKYIKKRYPDVVLHLSTQAGVCTLSGAKLAKEYGFERVILARETPLSEIEKIAAFMETEVFVQGALCTAFSGQCFFSSFVGGNSGNRGRCKQPCRKQYSYDRKGNDEKSYALSLSDLCVGEDIDKLIKAGVHSFKIEGRMRRAEYVGAAVRYYRTLLDGERNAQAFSDLKRSYNRGNYTKGLAFGQDKRFLSTAIQGHLGEKVGVVKVVNGKFLVESTFQPRQGDAFKVLRAGVEVGGGIYQRTEGKCFVLASKARLKNGDGVFITTDTAVNERILSAKKQGKVSLSLTFAQGQKPIAQAGEYTLVGDKPLEIAQSRPLTKEELETCFRKTDGLPVEIEFERITVTGDIFIPKSELNAFRRRFFTGLFSTERKLVFDLPRLPSFAGANGKTAVISTDFTGIDCDIAVYKPSDYAAPLPQNFLRGQFEKYVYYPAFMTEQDERALVARLQEGSVEGIYAENYSGIIFAREHNCKLFAGNGFHVFNRLALRELMEEVAYYALSKELSAKECTELLSDKAFALSSGGIKLMDLCYCPFGKTCAACDRKETYRLTDEGGRVFPVRRYRAADGNCRFEVYNCASLAGVGVKGAGRLFDLTLEEDRAEIVRQKDGEEEGQKRLGNRTSGHYHRGVL